VSGTRFWPFAAILATLRQLRQRSAKLDPRTPEGLSRWRVLQHFDLRGHPVMLIADPNGEERALDYATYPDTADISVERARGIGVEIDSAQFDGLLLARKFHEHMPMVAIGADGSAVIITAAGALTRRLGAAPRWRKGLHVPPEEYRQMRRAGPELAAMTMRDAGPRRAGAPTREELRQCAKDPILEEFSAVVIPHMLANLRRAAEEAEAENLAAEAIRRAARK
jgi:hypothetical protein